MRPWSVSTNERGSRATTDAVNRVRTASGAELLMAKITQSFRAIRFLLEYL